MARSFLSPSDRRALRVVSRLSPSPALRVRCAVVLWLDCGEPLASVARAFRLSRPTVYRILRLWLEFRDVAALHPAVARRLRPWRTRGPYENSPAVGGHHRRGTS